MSINVAGPQNEMAIPIAGTIREKGAVSMTRYLAVPVALILVLSGCRGERGAGKGSDESVAKKAGSKVGETLTEFASGVGAGVDTKMKIPVELSAALEAKGLKRTVAKSLAVAGEEKGFTVYLMAREPLSGHLLARAYEKDGSEIGRSRVEVHLGADDAKYVDFTFDSQMDANMVAKYVIDLSGK
jgi:hypothetical protein